MLSKYKKILVVAAHPDDEVLGCGGTIKKLTLKGTKVKIVFLSDGETSRNINQKKKKKIVLLRKKAALKASSILKAEKPIFLDYPDNQLDKLPLLNYVKDLEKIISSYKPEMIFTHSHSDLNIDHKIANSAVITATRPINTTVKAILFFETPSSTEWNFTNDKKFFKPNFYFDVNACFKFKINALKQYKSELRKWPHPRSIKAINLNAKKNGSVIGCEFAEAFQVGRIII
jgi:N-acetylglucosamine malate deacetylase 1